MIDFDTIGVEERAIRVVINTSLRAKPYAVKMKIGIRISILVGTIYHQFTVGTHAVAISFPWMTHTQSREIGIHICLKILNLYDPDFLFV